MSKANTVFTVTVNVTDNMFKKVVNAAVEDLIELYEPKELAEAGVNIAELKTQLFNDQDFRNHVQRKLAIVAKREVDSEIGSYRAKDLSKSAIIKDANEKLEAMADVFTERFLNKLEQERIKKAAKLLKQNGYAVQKAA